MRIGIVCPYSLDVAGGVQRHVLDLAAALRTLGHTVEVLAPTTGTAPEFVTPAGRAVGVPYNGSVARVAFGPLTRHRTRRWLAAHNFDVLHVHEPTTPSVSALALLDARGPVVATFHTSTERSRALAAFGPVARPLLERVTARIAVSATARRVQVEHLGGDATEIPNGVDLARFAHGPALDLPPAVRVGYVGRFDEPRKGMPVLLAALRRVVADRPDVRLLVVGRGDGDRLRRAAGPGLAGRIDLLGPVDEATKAAALRSVAVFCAPHRGGESFGMVLTEAMAAGAPVLAADLESFRAVLDDGRAGALFPPGDDAALAAALTRLLDDGAARARLAAAGRDRARRYDWPVVASDVLRVYRAAIAAAPRPLVRGVAR
ncbi:glycosyltransferase family 4 protein [Pseudonocardia alni]|uniref:Phosphatidylinositol alpha-mannosyltransferase n=2 Tax=Pseudonocardia TaxID=1847 RepID=A0A852W831_PSEA5|nr:glycosyltransferase family 4 protein [Pseudonocardia antarctica]NYG05069.1 phosphatidylinositol alpha-mannosyltransferase [Pseudonocardia antarctica]